MTERTGGSDVGGSETIARKNPDGTYAITGFKFFTSATTSPVTFLLARIVDDNVKVDGSKGLSVFLCETHKAPGELNNIIVHKLKNKVGLPKHTRNPANTSSLEPKPFQRLNWNWLAPRPPSLAK